MFCSPEEDRGCAIPALANQLRWLGTGHAGRLQPGEGLLKPLCVGLCCSAHVPSLLCDTVGLSLWSASFLGDAGAGGAWETALLVGTDSKAVCTGGGCRVWIVTGCNWWRGVSLKSNWGLILPFFQKGLGNSSAHCGHFYIIYCCARSCRWRQLGYDLAGGQQNPGEDGPREGGEMTFATVLW